MRGKVVAVVIALALSGPAVGQDSDAPAIQDVIQGQIEAFLKDDTATAFTFASPMIQGLFGSPENFGRMVQGGYPMIWKPSAVRYLGLRTENGMTFQRVLVEDAGGAIHLFDYEMIAMPEGWRINGVYPVKGNDAGA